MTFLLIFYVKKGFHHFWLAKLKGAFTKMA